MNFAIIVYNSVVGVVTGFYLHRLIKEYFNSNFDNRVIRRDKNYYRIIKILVIICLFNIMLREFHWCTVTLIFVTFFELWECYNAYGTVGKKTSLIQKRYEIYRSMSKKQLLNESILYKVNCDFTYIVERIMEGIVKIILLALSIVIGIDLSNMEFEKVKRVFDVLIGFSDKQTDLFISMCCGILIVATLLFRNSIEVSIRKHIVERLIHEVIDIK